MQIKIKFIRNLRTHNMSKKEYTFKISKIAVEHLNLVKGVHGWMENQFVENNYPDKVEIYHSVVKGNKVLSPFVITDIGNFDSEKHRKLVITKIEKED